MHFLKKLGMGSGILLVVWMMSLASAHDQLESSFQFDLESMEGIQEILLHLQNLLELQNGSVSENAKLACRCGGLECSCCHPIQIRRIGITGDCCLSITSLRNFKVELVLKFSGRTLFSKEISVKDPPPVCASMPFLKFGSSACIQLQNMSEDANYVSGCGRCWVTVFYVTVIDFSLGCFQMKLVKETNPVEMMERPNFDNSKVSGTNEGTFYNGNQMPMGKIKPAIYNKLK